MTEPTPTILGFPLNRVVAFIGPYVATLSGAAAAWALVHLHFLSLFHLGGDQLAQGIASLVTFVVTAVLTWLGHQKWLEGHQRWEETNALISPVPPADVGDAASERKTTDDTPQVTGPIGHR